MTKKEHRWESDRRDPLAITIRCSCGWSHRETRRQNALARAAKLNAAAARHAREVQAQMEQEEKDADDSQG